MIWRTGAIGDAARYRSPCRLAVAKAGLSDATKSILKGRGEMKRILLAMIAALTLSGCNIPDLDVASYHSRSGTGDGASATNAPATTTAAAQPPKSKYDADQPSENTGDYSNYF
jgi:hypothetical protein